MELQLSGLPRGDLGLLSARLFELGASGLQEDHLPGEAPPPRQPWDEGPPPAATPRLILRAWFEDPDIQRIDAELTDVRAESRWSPVPDTDWEVSWRAGFAPIRVSERLVIAPPWDAPDGALIISPGQGFGTGSHPTTLQALRAIETLSPGLRTALDIGCGSGILALAAARLGLEARGIDIEEAAVADAVANAERNALDAHFSTTPVAAIEEPADLVLANLHAELIVHFAPHLARLTGEWLVLAGILADREPSVREALDPLLALDTRHRDGEWISLHYRSLP